jgi:hypothetical protein
VGDCNGDGQVTVDEILTMVDIALGNVGVGTCTAGDANADGRITVDEILTAVRNALNGCGAPPLKVPLDPSLKGGATAQPRRYSQIRIETGLV